MIGPAGRRAAVDRIVMMRPPFPCWIVWREAAWEQNALGVHGHVLIPIVFIDFHGGHDSRDAGVVDQDIELAGRGFGHGAFGVGLTRNIHFQSDGLAPARLNLLGYGGSRPEIQIGCRHGCAFTGQTHGDCPANTVAAASNDGGRPSSS